MKLSSVIALKNTYVIHIRDKGDDKKLGQSIHDKLGVL